MLPIVDLEIQNGMEKLDPFIDAWGESWLAFSKLLWLID